MILHTIYKKFLRTKIISACILFFLPLLGVSVLNAQSYVDENNDTCIWDQITPVHYLNSLSCAGDLSMLSSIDTKQGHIINSMKVTYDFLENKYYFINNDEFETHFDFCKSDLNYTGSHEDYNETQYKVSNERKYFNFILSYFKDLDIYTFEFFRNDAISYPNILEVYQNIKPYVFFYDKLKFLPTTFNFSAALLDPSVPFIESEKLYDNTYEALNPAISYGYLRSIKLEYLDKVSPHDIIILDELSNDLPLCAGVITTQYQPTLSHINVLSRNRGTPNMVLANPLGDKNILGLIDSLVYFEVSSYGYKILPAKPEDAKKFWSENMHAMQNLPFVIDSTGLLDISDVDCNSTKIVGSKAANFGELAKINFDEKDSAKIPENAFAIPFYFYSQFLKRNHIDKDIHKLLFDSTIFRKNDSVEAQLTLIREKIMNGEMDTAFLAMVRKKIASFGDSIIPYRFRSSSNSEDLEFFNGAGLYTSKTGMLGSSKKSIEKAIKTVWASLWYYRAFTERRFFNLNQETVYMGILVHRAFPDELANGVAVTADIINQTENGIYLNIQTNEVSIVLPEDNSQCDEVVVTVRDDKYKIKYLVYNSDYPQNGTVLSDSQIERLYKILSEVKKHFYEKLKVKDPYSQFALDVEFKLDKTGNFFYIKQARRYPFIK
jgi:pyruvate, water dikinase